MPSKTQNLHTVTQHIPSTSNWHPGQYLYLQWAREIPSTIYWHPGRYLYLQWATYTQHKLLATWQISVPTMGNRYPAQVSGNLANICIYNGQERYPAQVTGNLANICTYTWQHIPITSYWQPGKYLYLQGAREIPSTSYWQSGKYLYLQWATDTQHK